MCNNGFVENLLNLNQKNINSYKLFDNDCFSIKSNDGNNYLYCTNTIEKLDKSVSEYKIQNTEIVKYVISNSVIYDGIFANIQILGCSAARLNSKVFNLIKTYGMEDQKDILKYFIINNGKYLETNLMGLKVILRQLNLLNIIENDIKLNKLKNNPSFEKENVPDVQEILKFNQIFQKLKKRSIIMTR